MASFSSPAEQATAGPHELQIKSTTKAFANVAAVDRCNFSMTRGEILVLLGPSGCGKSTLLNLIAGFERPDSGDILIRGQVVNDVPPHRRNVALVFQHYALFPHLTVEENIAYGLTARRMSREAIAERVAEMIALLKLRHLGNRYPAQLSGGQRQRTAVARALAIRPDMLLLDEAFSALDRNLREEMQLELSLLLRRLSVTTVVVTHDQREAFVLADRIAVMEEGRIAQIGSPEEVYRNPSTSSVFRFLGTVNEVKTRVATESDGPVLRIGEGIAFKSPFASDRHRNAGQLVLEIRSEDVSVSQQPTAVHKTNPATVRLRTFLGSQERIVLDVSCQQLLIDRPAQTHQQSVVVGQLLYVDFDPRRCRLAVEVGTPAS